MKAKASVPTRKSPPTTCLALSGGNALGAYSAGAIEALEVAGVRFDLISGASIGAVTAAIVAGNPPGQATQALHRFWALGSSGTTTAFWPWMQTPLAQSANGTPGQPRQRMARPTHDLREMSNAAHAMKTLMFGRPGLFHPSPIAQLPAWPGLHRPMALFDPRPVVQTLERLLDFERPHTHGPRLIVCAVDLESGEPVYFDSRCERITPLHLLASTAFLPCFPPVEIGGRLLGDPGLTCKLPLDPILQDLKGDRLCFAVDLFSRDGCRPHSFDGALERAQDVLFSAQSARTLEAFRREQRLRHRLQQALQGQRPRPGSQQRRDSDKGPPGEVEVVLSAYRPPAHEIGAKTLDFSAASLEDRWSAGQRDMAGALAAHAAKQAEIDDLGFRLYRAQAAPAASP